MLQFRLHCRFSSKSYYKSNIVRCMNFFPVKKAKVVFEYVPQEDDELTLQVGDIIHDVEATDTGWCKGVLNGRTGMFPDNFVQIMEEIEEKKAPAPPSSNKKPKKRMKVLYAYTADNDDELSLEIGSIVEFLKDIEEGWAEGSCNGKRGLFPTNFVELLPESSESEESPDVGIEPKLDDSNYDDVAATSSQKKVIGVGFGNIFGDGPIKLRNRSVDADPRKKSQLSTPPPAKVAKVPDKEQTKEIRPSAAKKKPVDYCKVLFEYNRENEDELSLKKGEIIMLVDRDGGDEGWWEGERVDEDGRKIRGVFPDNFVALLSPDEAKEHEKQIQGEKSDASKDTKYTKSPVTKEAKSSSIRKPAPVMPAPPSQANKPFPADMNVTTNEITNDSSKEMSFDEITVEHHLTHVKRPGGPKNRRKPGATERREKAQTASMIEQNGQEVISEEDEPPKKVESTDHRSTPKTSKMGVAVLPGLGAGQKGAGGDGSPGEAPSWLQSLRSRQSQRPTPRTAPPQVPPVAGAREPTAQEPHKPAWLANLKKRQSGEIQTTVPPKTPEKVTPPDQPAPAKSNGAALIPPAKPPGPAKAPPHSVPRPAVAPAADKPLASWQREMKSKKIKSETSEAQAPEPPATGGSGDATTPIPAWKNSLPRKATPAAHQPTKPTPDQPQKRPEKPPHVAVVPQNVIRVKPAPPRVKPVPGAKPIPSAALDEVREEVKSLRTEMEKMKDEFKREILKLNQDLAEERNQRAVLQDKLAKLQH